LNLDKYELQEVQIAIYHRVIELERELAGTSENDPRYENRRKNLERAVSAKEKIMSQVTS
jgi:hypothetical protein